MPKRTKNYSNIGERIKELRKKSSLTQKELSLKVNKSESSVRMWELGLSEPDIDTLNILSDIFSVPTDYIIGKSPSLDITTIPGIFIPNKKKLPMFGKIACGEPIYADESFEGYIEVEDCVNADFCLRAKGDSMIGARIMDGDIVIVKKQDMVNNGEIAVVLIDDEATLKRAYFYPEKNKIVLNPENPKYEPLVYIGEELNSIRILGKAVAFQSVIR